MNKTIDLSAEETLLRTCFRRYVGPGIIAMLSCRIAPCIDSITVAYQRGATSLSAIGVVSPIFYLFNIIAVLAGIGGGVMVSQAAGEGDQRTARRVFTKVTLALAIGSLVLLVLCLLFRNPIVHALGANKDNFGEALAYYMTLVAGLPFYIFSMAFCFLLVNDNARILSMAGMLISNLLNCLLDVLLVIKLGQGVVGAAIGTVMGQILACLIYLLHLRNGERLLKFDFSELKCIDLISCVKGGFPEATRYLLLFIQLALSNVIIGKRNGISGLADAAVMGSVILFIKVFMEGIAEVVMPMTSALYGEKSTSSIQLVKRIAIRYTFWLVIPMQLFVCAFPSFLLRIFSITDPEVCAMIPGAVRIISFTFLASGVNLIICNSFISTDKEGIAFTAVLLRDAVFRIPLVLFFGHFFGIYGVCIASVISEALLLVLLLTVWKGGEGFSSIDTKDLLLAVGGSLSKENIDAWGTSFLSIVTERYHSLAFSAFFDPLSRTLADGGSFNVSLMAFRTKDGDTACVLRCDRKKDMLYPTVKGGFFIDYLFSIERRMFIAKKARLLPLEQRDVVVVVEPEGVTGRRLCEIARERGRKVVVCIAETKERMEGIREILHLDEIFDSALCDALICADDWIKAVKKLKDVGHIVAVVPGSEISTEYSDSIALYFGVRGNDPRTALERRNKYFMKKAIKAAGLDHARGDKFENAEDAIAFIHKEISYPVFIKTPAGAASQNVFKVNSDEEVRRKAETILTTLDDYGRPASYFVVEETISGTEYAVNIFGQDDGKVVVTSIWEYQKIDNEFASNLYYNDFLRDPSDPKYAALCSYAVKLYAAVGIRRGPGHAEIRLSPRGPVAMEIGARIMGSSNEIYTQMAMHIDIPEATVQVYETGKADIPEKVVMYQHFGFCELPFVQKGRLSAIKGLDEIRNLDSYLAEELPIKIGDFIEPSTNLDMITCGIWLRGTSEKRLEHDMNLCHALFRLEVGA